MSSCVSCGENIDFVDEESCEACDAVLCKDCYTIHNGICEDCKTDDIDDYSIEDIDN